MVQERFAAQASANSELGYFSVLVQVQAPRSARNLISSLNPILSGRPDRDSNQVTCVTFSTKTEGRGYLGSWMSQKREQTFSPCLRAARKRASKLGLHLEAASIN